MIRKDGLFNDIFEGVNDISTNIYLNIREIIHGKINVYYNKVSDCLEIYISNRALNIEPFHATIPTFYSNMLNGISSKEISDRVIREYRKYVNMYIWKEKNNVK